MPAPNSSFSGCPEGTLFDGQKGVPSGQPLNEENETGMRNKGVP